MLQTRLREEPLTEEDEIEWDAWITIKEAATLAGLRPSTLRSAIYRGKLHARKFVVYGGLSFTTRHFLHNFLITRNPGGMGHPAKPMPEGYHAPPPNRVVREPYFSKRRL